MKTILPILLFLAELGAPGLFLVGVLDSSFLFLPFGNDLLMLGLSAQHPAKIAYFAFFGALGSMVGCALIDKIARKGGEEGLSRLLPEKRIDYVKQRVTKHAAPALALAALLPPPFPFTPFVAAAAALQYPRFRMFAVLMCARMLRFCIIGVLGVAFGRSIIAFSRQPVFQYSVLGLLAICIIGSAYSVYGWIQRSKKRVSAGAPA
jgi:membrane protein DedA with SNARE-associated domain